MANIDTATAPKAMGSLPLSGENESKALSAKYFPEFDIQGYVIIVTGGGRGLGLTMAEALYQAGAIVHCLDGLPEPEDELLRVYSNTNRISGGSMHYHALDIRDTEQLQKLIADIANQHSKINGLIAAAGVQKITPALEYCEKDVHDMLDINYTAAFMTAQEVGKQMLQHNSPGSIVLVASISGQIANRGLYSPVYNSSKAAVMQLCRNLAMEWGPHGIRVNSLCPGHILTPMVQQNFKDEPHLEGIWKNEIMLGRLSNPNEFRGIGVFLLSQASSFMEGSNINIDGGQTAW